MRCRIADAGRTRARSGALPGPPRGLSRRTVGRHHLGDPAATHAEGHTWHHADCDLVDTVNDGLPPQAGYPVMPAFGEQLSDEEIRLILEHIKTWWEPDQREFQAQVTDEVCS
jgi:hypothetical protein